MSAQTDWHKANKDAQIISFVLAVGLAIALRLFFRLPLLPTAVIALFVGLMAYELYGRRRDAVSRFFTTPTPEAQAAIITMLQNKGIPYTQQHDRFTLTEDEIILRVARFRTRRSGKKGTFISLRPLNQDSFPLLHSLQRKIDEAFADQAL